MGVFPIGFFSPLPLAMMIPFMATQSLAMGEAFGKSFQYGKRKISSMTNEEFNKLTFENLMQDQTANIRTIIPNLHEQMQLSYSLQIDIFQEMVKIIPAFFEALMKVWKESDVAQDFANFDKDPFGNTIPRPDSGGTLVSATQPSDPALISNENYVAPIPIVQDPHFDRLWKHSQYEISSASIETLNTWYKNNDYSGTEERRAIFEAQQKGGVAQTYEPPTGELAPPINDTLLEAQAFTAWQKVIIENKNAFLIYEGNFYHAKANNNIGHMREWKTKADAISTFLRSESQDYRNPNEGIRQAVIALRQELADGKWKIPYHDLS